MVVNQQCPSRPGYNITSKQNELCPPPFYPSRFAHSECCAQPNTHTRESNTERTREFDVVPQNHVHPRGQRIHYMEQGLHTINSTQPHIYIQRHSKRGEIIRLYSQF